jgi:hypothetical protein
MNLSAILILMSTYDTLDKSTLEKVILVLLYHICVVIYSANYLSVPSAYLFIVSSDNISQASIVSKLVDPLYSHCP